MIFYVYIMPLVTVELASFGVGITKKLQELWMKILPWPMGTVMLALTGTKVCTNCDRPLEIFVFMIFSHHSFSHYCILPIQVCKIMKHCFLLSKVSVMLVLHMTNQNCDTYIFTLMMWDWQELPEINISVCERRDTRMFYGEIEEK